jgi:2-polyprenyl-6-methoxyphenol hydroxylase-like FAD-dependent oxidoreductase
MRYDVVVAGAGPAGLMLAGEVARTGHSVLVVERRPERSSLSRAFGVHARTLEALDSRGLADDLLTAGARVSALRLFGGVRLDLARLPTRFPFLLVTPQTRVDRLLEGYAVSAGAVLERGAALTSLEQDADGVRVTLSTASGPRTVTGSYLVGADGVHSTVRNLLGLPFPGRAVLRSIMLADVRLARPPQDVVTVNAVGDAFAFVAPFGDGWWRVFAWNRGHQVDDTAPLDFEEVRAVTRRALGTDLGMHDPRWSARFHSDERQVPAYRRGRVFLVGDAAHVHSPAGGQGMNTGIQDALNLGWKLAAALDGAPDAVLDSYQDERHPVGRMVLRSSGAIVRAAMAPGRLQPALRNLALGTLLRLPPVVARAAGQISGVGIRYPRPPGTDRLVGTRAADLPLAGGGRLYETLRDAGWVLVLGSASPSPSPGDAGLSVVRRGGEGPDLLVRPDGYVGWAGSGDGWRAELSRWRRPVTASATRR